MWGINKKAILVETGEYYSEDDTPSVYATVIDSLSELMTKLGNDISGDRSALEALLKNPHFVKALDAAGYRDVEKIVSAVEKVKAGTRFFIHNGETYPSIREIDLFTKDRYAAEQLAGEKVMILQNVEKSSLRDINSTAYRHMLNAKKRIEAASKARTAKAKNREKTLKAKELARELLKEAGEL